MHQFCSDLFNGSAGYNMRPVFIFLWLIVCIYGAQDTGFPAGLMADCPGMTKNTTMSAKTKRSLRVVVLWESSGWPGSNEESCQLSVSGADCVARHVELADNDVLVFVSGYLDASFSPMARGMAAPYLEQGRVVIILELFPLLFRTYPVAARLTKPLGRLLGEFLAELTKRGLSPHRLHILGGSLGAHIGSYAATKYHELTHWKPYRLTGLDPAGPCFRNLPSCDRFNANAAYKVDALHTNIDGFGIADAVAQVDFYANGGEFQTKLSGNFLLPCLQLCSHWRAATYWLLAHEHTDAFLAVRCDSVSDVRHGRCYDGEIVSNALGPKTNFSRPGIYYLPTIEKEPYYLGNKGLASRKYGVNHYFLKLVRDEDMII